MERGHCHWDQHWKCFKAMVNLKGWERAIVNQTSTGTVSKPWLTWKEEKGPLSIRPTLELFQGHGWLEGTEKGHCQSDSIETISRPWLTWNYGKGPLSIRPALKLFQRQHWGNFREKGWPSTYGFPQARRFHLQMNWTVVNSLFSTSEDCVTCHYLLETARRSTV